MNRTDLKIYHKYEALRRCKLCQIYIFWLFSGGAGRELCRPIGIIGLIVAIRWHTWYLLTAVSWHQTAPDDGFQVKLKV